MTCRVVDVDLSGAAPVVEATGAEVYAVFWWGDLPIGARRFAPQELPARRDRLLPLAAELLARQLASRLPQLGGTPRAGPDGRPRIAPPLAAVRALHVDESVLAALSPSDRQARDVSVIVCTRDRPAALRVCLSSLSAQRSPPGEIVVVDNSAAGTAAGVCADFPGVRRVHEPRPGLSRARNAGIAAATRRLLAFTDDDVEAHPGWCAELARAFAAAPDVDAVTGLVLPESLDTPAQRFFQFDLGGFGDGDVPIRFDRGFIESAARLGPQVWRVGAGANMAFRREVFQRVGPFDERLGAGAAGCSEDSEMWYRILAGGGVCLYEPWAVVRHRHRAAWAELERQAHDYMRGHVAALRIQHRLHGHAGNRRRIWLQLPRHLARTGWRALESGSPDQRRIVRRQLAGWAGGLLLPVPAERSAAPDPPTETVRKAPVRAFLAANPFPAPLTGGLFYREKMRAIHRVAPDRLSREGAPPRVLEIGGGRSGLATLLYPGARITNVDLDFDLLGKEPGAEGARFVCGDACRLPFADDSFDAVTLFDVLEHIPDDAAAAREALRVTRPGGWVLVSTPHAAWRYPYHQFMRRWCPPEEALTTEWGHVRRGYTVDALASLFGAAPFRSATFVNAVTAFYHDVGFSRIGPLSRRVIYGATAPLTAVGYLLHRPHTPGTETAVAWRRE